MRRYRGRIDTGPTPLLGRDAELRALRAVITGARNGVSGALVVRGEPGIGKTALLRAAVDGLDGVRVLRTAGHETEQALPFAGLQRVGIPLADHVADLPGRHADALRVAGGSLDGPPPGRYLVGLAMLGLFALAGQDEPLVLAVDDAHWLDTESLDVLAFVARRLQAESVALLLTTRTEPSGEAPDDPDDRLAGIPSLLLGGLGVTDAGTLLAASTGHRPEPQVLARIVGATGGNPLALVDLATDLDPRALADLSWSDEPLPVGRRLEHHYLRRVRELPPATQRWLLVAAASSTGRTDLVESAGREVGCPGDAGHAAQAAGLVRVGDHVRFRHPLVRAAVYSAAGDAERRRAHVALARTATGIGLADVAAWHVAEAAFGVDEAAAQLLEDSAGRAGRRGGVATRARLLARAADLTRPGTLRADRLLDAAQAASEAGTARLAHDLLDRAAADGLDPLREARAIVVRASTAPFLADPQAVVGGAAELVRAADLLRGRSPALEQDALLRAFELYQTAEWAMQGLTLADLGRRLRLGAASDPGTTAAVVLEALAALVLDPFPEAVPRLRDALDVLDGLDDAQVPAFGPLGTAITSALWDERGRAALLRRGARVARDAGSLRLLDACLWILALTEVERGDPASGSAYVAQTRELRQALGYDGQLVVNAAELAWTGAPRELVEAVGDGGLRAGFGGAHTIAHAALAARDLAEGRYDEAYERLQPMVARHQIHVTHHQLADHVEAAVRSGHPDVAAAAADELDTVARACGSSWALGVAARSRALVTPGADAETWYLEAVRRLSHGSTPVDLARAHLLYGEWLRRLRRRADAREHLRAALHGFVSVTAPAFAERARAELEAAGGHVTVHAADDDRALTPREAAVARLAAAGQTNAEIGATLFISANTVDYHLRKVFQKLGVTSRRRLAAHLGNAPG